MNALLLVLRTGMQWNVLNVSGICSSSSAHRRFSEWSARVVQHLNKMDFDFIWANDDHADTKMPWVNLEMWEEFMKPYQMMVAREIRKPWIFHSDGNLFPILDGLLTLGMNAIHPVQPSAMDIDTLKQKYGNRVCIVGNIDLDYTLTLGPPEGVDAEVIDLRTLVPMDTDAILDSLGKTGRLVIVDYAHRTCGAAAEIAAIVAEEGFDLLKKPIRRVTTPDVPIPFSPPLEKPLYPNRDSIAAIARSLM